ncbi:MAG TPA: hypothetical protein VGQ83_07255 [Polyangia bacterium]
MAKLIIVIATAAAGCGSGGASCPADQDCTGRTCGLDPVCLVSCGDCSQGEVCSLEGQCQGGSCPAAKACGSRACGPDPVCGESCGSCDAGSYCNTAGACAPVTGCPGAKDCAGRACGPDPQCGLSCGDCAANEQCTAAGLCVPVSCTDYSACAATELCLSGSCVSVWGHVWRVTAVDGRVPATMPDGSSWDPFSGLPDPMMAVTIDGVTWTSASVDDTVAPAWNQVLGDVTVSQTSTIRVVIRDYDTATYNDFMSDTGADPIPVAADWLRRGAITFTTPDQAYQYTLRFELQ